MNYFLFEIYFYEVEQRAMEKEELNCQIFD